MDAKCPDGQEIHTKHETAEQAALSTRLHMEAGALEAKITRLGGNTALRQVILDLSAAEDLQDEKWCADAVRRAIKLLETFATPARAVDPGIAESVEVTFRSPKAAPDRWDVTVNGLAVQEYEYAGEAERMAERLLSALGVYGLGAAESEQDTEDAGRDREETPDDQQAEDDPTELERWARVDDDVYYLLRRVRLRVYHLAKAESIESRETRLRERGERTP